MLNNSLKKFLTVKELGLIKTGRCPVSLLIGYKVC